MESTLLVGDRIFVLKNTYGYSKHSFPYSPSISNKRYFFIQPTQGDLVVFKNTCPHKSSKNNSNTSRRVLYYTYLDEKYGLQNIAYMGDGYHDAEILRKCCFGIAPLSGRKEAKQAANYITESVAGNGAVLDASLEILRRFFNEQ